MENITTPLGGDFPVAFPGTTLLPLLLDLPLAGGALGALGGHCRPGAVTTCDASCKKNRCHAGLCTVTGPECKIIISGFPFTSVLL